MAYYMMCEKKRGDYELVDITRSDLFSRTSKFKNSGCDLLEIDSFTTQFRSEEALRAYLFTAGLLSSSNVNKNLTIRRKNKGNYDKVEYGFLYQKDIDYITDPRKLIKRILNKLYAEDLRFIGSFANHYINHRECSSTMPDVRHYVNESVRRGYMSSGFYETDENGDNLIERAVKLLIYKYYQEYNGRITYKNEIVYRNLHSLICFVNNYDKKHEEELAKEEEKVRKRKIITGDQISFL